ncbi:GTP 3',8-cyclase MoaA [Paenibacillus donghaensis]|uniref:GTP 3',8-cyclase MoaA n=1 Tax=Paenibacillus donghaensis TaxID=414771 RepID=UPI00188393DB|nr:GTP 3',8-cyclase MoaA [Paenibacillus donghaensis]MBE9914121.1 GTP 3',8-cyclase MoaA [Paenibacillus donghaensis]
MAANPIVDQLARPMRDLRISVTDRCNFRCAYCMPKEFFGDDYAFMPKEKLLSWEEITRLAGLYATLGIRKIRLTGGEPLLRRGLPELIRMLSSIRGIDDIGCTTNGLLLGQQAQNLYDAGLRRINVSLDALDPDLFGRINGRGVTSNTILRNIDLASEIGLQVKINMVVQKDVNEQEILPMADYFKKRGITLCFIEFMDAGNANGWSLKKVVTKKEIWERLGGADALVPVQPRYPGEVAKRFRYKDKDGQAEVGIISSVSEAFCSSCTRVRLSSDGKIYTCLFASKGFDLRALLRGGASDEELLAAIRKTWEQRGDRYSEKRTEHTAKNLKKIGMSYIGG